MDKLYFFVLLLLTCIKVQAQTCGGEVVRFRETFGTGTSRAALAPGRTNYNYNGSGSLTDGDYTLFRTTQAKPEWHNSTDHTGDADGRMMVTNASYAPGEFYRDTVYGVSSVSTYNIYFYAMNVNTVGTCSPNPILPGLQVIVESYNFDGSFTEIYTLTSSLLPQTSSPTWVRISGQFYLPVACTAVRYRIINNSTGGCGNDLAIDDITFSQCNPTLLPVTGLVLKASNDNGINKLAWFTLTETNANKFLVQKTENGSEWKNAGIVKATGISHSKKEYSFTDNVAGANYSYRIAAVDNDGKIMYSNIINLRSSGQTSDFTAFPSPFTDYLNLFLSANSSRTVNIRMIDLNGRLARSVPWQLKPGENKYALSELGGLTPGMYVINITDMNGSIISKVKVIKKS